MPTCTSLTWESTILSRSCFSSLACCACVAWPWRTIPKVLILRTKSIRHKAFGSTTRQISKRAALRALLDLLDLSSTFFWWLTWWPSHRLPSTALWHRLATILMLALRKLQSATTKSTLCRLRVRLGTVQPMWFRRVSGLYSCETRSIRPTSSYSQVMTSKQRYLKA